MAKIDIPPWRIKSNRYCWSVYIPKYTKKGREYPKDETFYPSLQSAVNSLLDRRLRDSDVTSLREVQEEIQRFKEELVNQFEIRIRAEE